MQYESAKFLVSVNTLLATIKIKFSNLLLMAQSNDTKCLEIRNSNFYVGKLHVRW